MQVMPATASKLGVTDPDTLYDPGTALSVGQKYIEQLLNRLDGNLLELGGAYNAGPMAVNRWRTTKAGGEDPLLFVESIPVAGDPLLRQAADGLSLALSPPLRPGRPRAWKTPRKAPGRSTGRPLAAPAAPSLNAYGLKISTSN